MNKIHRNMSRKKKKHTLSPAAAAGPVGSTACT